jgi:hypothetical protein
VVAGLHYLALAYADLAEVLEVAGRLDDAAEAFEQARVRCEGAPAARGAACSLTR